MSFRFQQFPVYLDIKLFIKGTFIVTKKFPQNFQYDLAAQIKRAAISILLNLAEGSGRGSDKDFNRFLMIAIGSVDEVIAGFDIAYDNNIISREIYNKFYIKGDSIKRQLGGLSKKLKMTGD